MKKAFFHIVFTLIGIVAFTGTIKAQRFPATVNPVIIPPSSVYFHDYFSADDKIRLTLLFNDFNESSFDVKLRFSLEGNGIIIRNKDGFVPSQPISLVPGAPTLLTSSDLTEYVEVNNLNFTGVSPNFLLDNGRLEEGMYSFCFEVLDYESGKVISQKSCANVWVMLKDPPFIITPAAGSNVTPSEPLFIPFQWQVNNINSPTSSFDTEYQLTLFDVEETGVDPLVALNNGKALQIYQSDWQQQTQFIFDLSAAQLDLGEQYVFYVQARNIDGQEVFKNDGVSEVSHFTYGFSEGGNIPLSSPADEETFSLGDVQSFGWESPDNLTIGQSFNYNLKIVEIQEGQSPEEAIATNDIWYDYTSPIYSAGVGSNILLTQPLETNQDYAWQVSTLSGSQVTATSAVRTFKGPPLIEKFRAGDHIVTVTKTTSEDLNALNGEGRIKLSEDGTDSLNVAFEELTINEAGGLYYLSEGTITADFDQPKEIKLRAENDLNGEATFYGTQLRLDKDGMDIYGDVKWPFSHPVTSEEQALVTSNAAWFNYDSYKVKGIVELNEDNSFELLDPYGYQFTLAPTSSINVDYNTFIPTLNGDITLPTDLATGVDDEAVVLPFELADQLYYFSFVPRSSNPKIQLVQNTSLTISPIDIIYDFSEGESPEKLKSEPNWKGVYFETYSLSLNTPFDATNQLVINQPATDEFTLDPFNTNKAWFDANGLTLTTTFKFLEEQEATFNSFETTLDELAISIVNNSISDSQVSGSIHLPLLDPNKEYTYTIPLSGTGFLNGYLDNSLNDTKFIFNPYGQENKMEMTILRAVFADNERLDMTLDIDIPYMSATIPSISDFRLYGDYSVGFGEKNGAKYLDHQVEGVYETFPLLIDQVAASLIAGRYSFSYSATMSLGEEVSGQDGPPRVNFHSVGAANEDLEDASSATNTSDLALSPPIEQSGAVQGDSKTLSIDSVQISVSSAIAEFTGYLIMTKNDPEWGTSLQGGINGSIKVPSNIDLGANMILGNKDNVKYWYFDAYFVDDGAGINVFNMFNLVGFEGKVYRHMSLDLDEAGSASPVIDPSVEFGAGLYMQMIDTGGGKTYMADIGAEIVVDNEGFVVQMQGDVSALNDEGRDMNAAASLKASVAEAVEEAATSAVLDAIGPIEVDIPINSKTLSVAVSSEQGSFGYTDGDFSAKVTGDIAETPTVGLEIESGAKKIAIEGNVDASGSVLLQDNDNYIGLDIGGSGKGSFDFSYDQLTLGAAVDSEEGSASFKADYDNNGVEFIVNKSENYGKLQLNQGNTWNAMLELDDGTGTVEFGYDEFDVSLSANKEATQGRLKLGTSAFTLETALDKEARSGLVDLTVGENNIKVSGDENGGEIGFAYNSFEYYSALDKSNSEGTLSLSYGDGRRMYVKGSAEGKGELEFEFDGNALSLLANKPDAQYGINLSNDQIGELTLATDGANGTKAIGIQFGNENIEAFYSGDSTIIKVTTDGQGVGIGYANQERFIVSFGLDSSTIDLGNTGFSFGEGTNLIYQKGSSPTITLSTSEISVAKGSHDLTASNEAISYSDDNFNFDLDREAAKVAQSDRSLAINFMGEDQGLMIVDGDRSLAFSSQQVRYVNGEDYFSVGGEYMIAAAYEGKEVQINTDYIGLALDENKNISFGGDNFIALAYESSSFSVSKQKDIAIAHDDMALGLSSEKVLTATQGAHTVTLNDQDKPIQYSNDDFSAGLIASAGNYGVSVGVNDVNVSLSTYKYTNATLALDSDLGVIALTGDANSNLEASFTRGDRTIVATTGNDGITFSDSNDEEETPELTQVGTPTPEMVGPQYIGKITDDASGRVVGTASLYYNSADKHFIANGAVAATGGPCLSGSFAIEASPETWSIDIGTEEDRIEVYPTCTGFGGGGWLGLTPSSLNIGVFAGFQAEASIKLDWGIGYAKIWSRVAAELGVRADADLTPVFVINEVGVWIYLYAGLGVEYDIGIDKGNFTIAEAELKGTLLLNFENGTNLSGKLEGRITVLGIKGKFKLGFNEGL